MSAVGDRLAIGATPVPFRVTTWSPPLALSEMTTAPPQGPAEAGRKVTLRVQFAPAASTVPQLFVSGKLLEVLATLEMVNEALPVLVSVTTWGALTAPAAWFPKVRLVGDRLATRAARPEPVRLAVWGLPGALSTIDSVPVRLPAAVGVNTTLIVQCAPAATEAPQSLVWPKSPVVVIPEIDSAAFPVLESVIACAALGLATLWLLKFTLDGNRLAAGAFVPPVPVRLTVCGLPPALSLIETEPVRAPEAVGVKVTVTVQWAPGAIELPQLFVWAKSPPAVMPVRFSAAPPVLLRVTVWAPLVLLSG